MFYSRVSNSGAECFVAPWFWGLQCGVFCGFLSAGFGKVISGGRYGQFNVFHILHYLFRNRRFFLARATLSTSLRSSTTTTAARTSMQGFVLCQNWESRGVGFGSGVFIVSFSHCFSVFLFESRGCCFFLYFYTIAYFSKYERSFFYQLKFYVSGADHILPIDIL